MAEPRPPGRAVRDARGSAVLLLPAAVLVIIVLGSLAVDSAITFTAQRQLADAAAAAANDAATAGVAADAFYRCEGVQLDPVRVRHIAIASIQARSADIVDAVHAINLGRDATGAPTVTVHLAGAVTPLFAPALPGGDRTRPIQAHATASAIRQHPDLDAATGCQD